MRLRYGLNDEEPLTLKEIGQRVGLTRERVRQIEIEALEKLEQRLSSDKPFANLNTTRHGSKRISQNNNHDSTDEKARTNVDDQDDVLPPRRRSA